MVEKIDPGEMGLYPNCIPPLKAGLHTCAVRQVVKNDEGTAYSMPSRKSQKVKIEGPRFIFNPDEIHSLFPPMNDCGNFYNRLPQIVLRRRTLPWERNASEDGKPWLALLLVNEYEISDADGHERGKAKFHEQLTVADLTRESAVTTTQEPVQKPLRPSGQMENGKDVRLPQYDMDVVVETPSVSLSFTGRIHPPQIETTVQEKTQSCMAVDMPKDLFYDICPRKEELDLLSHVRIVSTEDKELLGQDEDGWFSVVTCNRLPDKNTRVDEKTKKVIDQLKHRAFLVSLEGHGARLREAVPPAGAEDVRDSVGDNDFIRLAVLVSWEFTSKNDGDFQSVITNIGRNGGVGLLGDIRDNCVTIVPPKDTDAPPAERNTVTIETAHIPVSQSYRTGEKGVGLYRGPFTPSPIAYNPQICHTADAAIVIDPVTGLEQIGYAAAFELGRLLGASDETLAVGLLKWRREGYQDIHFELSGRDFAEGFRLPFDRENWRTFANPFEEIFDPLGPLVNPAEGYFLNNDFSDFNQIDLCGMSAEYTQNVRKNIMDEANLSESNVGRDRVMDVIADVEMAVDSTYSFQDARAGKVDISSSYRVQILESAAQNVKGTVNVGGM